jgi:hypothetical protein
VRSASRKCATATDHAVCIWRRPDRDRVLLRGDRQRHSEGGAPLAGGRVVETNAADVGVGHEYVRAGTGIEGDLLSRCSHCSRLRRGSDPACSPFTVGSGLTQNAQSGGAPVFGVYVLIRCLGGFK